MLSSPGSRRQRVDSFTLKTKPERSFETSGTAYHKTHCENPKDLSIQQHCSANVKSSKFVLFYTCRQRPGVINPLLHNCLHNTQSYSFPEHSQMLFQNCGLLLCL